MSFIPSDCHLIVMDNPATGEAFGFNSVPIALDDLKALHDAGATVALEFLSWDRIETSHGVYDWSMADETVSRARAAGMRVLYLGPDSVPQWCPDEWYVWGPDGKPIKTVDPHNIVTVWGCLSPWNAEAQGYQNDFIAQFCRRYNADDVLCIQSHSRAGEALLPPGIAALYDPAAVASYRRFAGDDSAKPDPGHYMTQAWMYQALSGVLLAQQRIYCESSPYREVWMQLHPYYAAWPNSGNARILDYYRAVSEIVDPDTFNALMFTAFDNGHDSFIWPFVKELQTLGIHVWTGSEWSAGLITNTPRAIALGLRGTLTGPCHPYLRKTKVEPWELDAFRAARDQWRAA